MLDSFRDQLAAVIDNLPPLSPSVSKILELANDITASPKDLLNIIKIDPVLTGKILKVINSAYYAMPNQVASLNKALILMGFNTIKNLALSTAIIENVRAGESKEFDSAALWDHCLAVAVASKSLARAAGVKITELEEYFIAGLLHDIGRVVIIQNFPEQYINVIEHPDLQTRPLVEIEQEIMGLNHCEAGAIIARKWQLPESLTTVIENHHSDSDHLGTCIVHIADKYCKKTGTGYDVDGNYRIRTTNLAALNIPTEKILASMENLRVDLEKARILLSA